MHEGKSDHEYRAIIPNHESLFFDFLICNKIKQDGKIYSLPKKTNDYIKQWMTKLTGCHTVQTNELGGLFGYCYNNFITNTKTEHEIGNRNKAYNQIMPTISVDKNVNSMGNDFQMKLDKIFSNNFNRNDVVIMTIPVNVNYGYTHAISAICKIGNDGNVEKCYFLDNMAESEIGYQYADKISSFLTRNEKFKQCKFRDMDFIKTQYSILNCYYNNNITSENIINLLKTTDIDFDKLTATPDNNEMKFKAGEGNKNNNIEVRKSAQKEALIKYRTNLRYYLARVQDLGEDSKPKKPDLNPQTDEEKMAYNKYDEYLSELGKNLGDDFCKKNAEDVCKNMPKWILYGFDALKIREEIVKIEKDIALKQDQINPGIHKTNNTIMKIVRKKIDKMLLESREKRLQKLKSELQALEDKKLSCINAKKSLIVKPEVSSPNISNHAAKYQKSKTPSFSSIQ